jgi:hypothetical protein
MVAYNKLMLWAAGVPGRSKNTVSNAEAITDNQYCRQEGFQPDTSGPNSGLPARSGKTRQSRATSLASCKGLRIKLRQSPAVTAKLPHAALLAASLMHRQDFHAASIVALGAGYHEVVSFQLPNWQKFIAVCLTCVRTGAAGGCRTLMTKVSEDCAWFSGQSSILNWPQAERRPRVGGLSNIDHGKAQLDARYRPADVYKFVSTPDQLTAVQCAELRGS